jgi:MFS family permease
MARDTEHDDKRRSLDGESYQRHMFGGFNFGAAFFGWLVTNSVSVLLVALLTALGSAVTLTATDNATDSLANNAATVGVVGGVLLLIALAIAYFGGGYVAGRMSRFDGGKQGMGVWVMGIVITLILGLAGALLGSSFNLLQQLNLPSIPVDAGSFTAGGLITLLAILVVSFLAAVSGGKVGERYHHKVDKAGRTNA